VLNNFSMRVRTRLMLAFFFLIFATLTLATVSWNILQDANRALTAFQADALPDISRSLELAERTSNLAAAAPYLTNAASASTLRSESEDLQERTRLVLELADSIPELEKTAPRLQELLSQLEQTVTRLVELTNQRLFLREDLLQFEYDIDSLVASVQMLDETEGSEILLMAERMQLSTKLNSIGELARLNQRVRMQYLQMDPLLLGQNREWQRTIEHAAIDPGNLFELKRTELILEQQGRFLLSTTRAIADQLSIEVGGFVASAEALANSRSAEVNDQLAQGLTRITLLTALCVIVAIAGIVIVGRLSKNLAAVTSLMTRLSQGNRSASPPRVKENDEIGELVTAFGVFQRNAQEIKEMGDSLRQQTKLLETVFSSINDGLSVFDKHDRLRAWNPQYASMLKLPVSELQPGMPMEAITQLLPEAAQDSWSLKGGVLDRDELRVKRQQTAQRFERRFEDGRIVEFRSSPLPEGGFVTLYSDLTERKEIESQLRQAQKMEVLGQLTGGVAHDFNNLLAAVIGNLQLVEMRLDKADKARGAAERALTAAERGEQLTQRLLAFSRKQRLEPELTIIDELIEGIRDLLEYSVGSKIDIQLDLQAPDALSLLDPGQMENSLLNLAINSASAMPEGGKLVLRTAMKAGPAGDFGVLLDVIDTGSGIAPEFLSRVFEPFFTTKKVGEGSGLGLSMVYGFVKQSDGELHIDSKVGQGTKISIWMPVTDPLEIDERDALSDAPRSTAQRGQGQQILVVEDDPQVRAMITDMLTELGFSPTASADYDSAIGSLESNSDIQLVFTDINLGERRTGIDLMQQIARDWPTTAVVLTSGLPPEQLTESFGLDSTATVLAKPYSKEALLERLNQALA